MKTRKSIALIGFLSPLLMPGRICFAGEEGGGGGTGTEAKLTPEQETELDEELGGLGLGELVKTSLKLPGIVAPPAAAKPDNSEAALELQSIYADEELAALVQYKKNTGGKIADLLKNTGTGTDYDTVDADVLHEQMIKEYPDSDKTSENTRWKGLSKFQKDNEVRSFRSEMKAKNPVSNGKLFEVITDFNQKAAPIKQKESSAVKSYVSLLATTIKDIKDPDGKELDADTAESIFETAKSISALKWKKTGDGNVLGTSADDAKVAAKNATLIVLGDKIIQHTADSFSLLGARTALARRFKVNDNSGGGNHAGQRGAGGDKGPVLPKGTTEIVREKVGTSKQNVHQKT